jgi:tripartite-type tricarboxylate transporter receptor subunit TctC
MKLIGIVYLLFFAIFSHAQTNYPNHPIRLVIPFPPGGGADITARILTQKISESTGQPFVIEYKAGAAGNIAAEYVAKAPNDGYTLLLATNGLVIQPHLQKVSWDPIKDFQAISTFATYSLVIAIQPKLPFNNMNDLVNFAKANPNQLTYGSSGSGGPLHIGVELFCNQAGIKILHVPYKGNAPMNIGLLSGDIDMVFDSPMGPLQNIRLGKAKAIATTGKKRSYVLPDVPTVAESVLPNFSYETWNAILAPAGTPRDIVKKLNQEMIKAVANPDVQASLIKIGYEPQSSSPEEFEQLMKTEYQRFGRLIVENKIKLD